MIIEFDCFLIDEITAVGDARFHDRCNYELFEKRSNRAMIIISHDAGYIRDHCNRWAVLDNAQLTQFDDFDVAYSAYKEMVQVSATGTPPKISFANRERLIESSQRVALADEAFRILVQQGDWSRDQQEWAKAESEYAEALEIYPYQRSYWTQHGHVSKEQDEFARAEISYRTAIALGEPAADVEEFLHFVMGKQDIDAKAYPASRTDLGDCSTQPPCKPDVELLAWLLWRDDLVGEDAVLAHLRAHQSCDALAATMIASDQSIMQPDGQRAAAPLSMGGSGDFAQFRLACCLLEPDMDGSTVETAFEQLGRRDEILPWFLAGGAFANWPLSQAALAETGWSPQNSAHFQNIAAS